MLDDKDTFGSDIFDAYVLAVEATAPYVPRYRTFGQLKHILVRHQLPIDTELRRRGLLPPSGDLYEV